jgi:3-oxoacyl-[acyl-carrier-protein] synthase II
MTSDARHYVAPSLPTVTAAIEEAFRDAGIISEEIDAINAHAASTGVGDGTEVKALRRVFGENVGKPISANKSQIGHTMGASSAIELILAIEGLERGLVLPTVNYLEDPELGGGIDVVTERARGFEHRRVLSNSFGFGGCNVCLVIARP